MGDPKAFLSIPRQDAGNRPVMERVKDYSEVEQVLNRVQRRAQMSRCMDCGVPFCHWACPLGNKQPEWQDAAGKGKYKLAYRLLTATNDFPEFTGRICPALCEKSCVLNLVLHEPVTVRENEVSIIELAFSEGFVQPVEIERNGRKVAVVGSGPSGLACANRLNHLGYEVTVFEKNEAAGGQLRFGIPNFKLEKDIIDRRIRLMEEEGVVFRYGVAVEETSLPEGFDAYVIATGTPVARDLPVPGRELKGVHFALELLSQQNRVLAGQEFPAEQRVSAKGKNVLVIGGGDTGSDCIGTCRRQGAKRILQIEIMPQPPVGENPATPWPQWPVVLKTSSSHEEGCDRRWCLSTNRFIGENGVLKAAEIEEVEWLPAEPGQRPQMRKTGRVETVECDLALLAMGFLKPEHPALPDNVFVVGDAKSGASLVVRAIASGRDTAYEIDRYLSR